MKIKTGTIGELIERLAKLNKNQLYVCGYASDESLAIIAEVSEIKIADEWHDSLPPGTEYVQIHFRNTHPGIRIKGQARL